MQLVPAHIMSMSKDTEFELFRRAHKGDIVARNTLVLRFLPMVLAAITRKRRLVPGMGTADQYLGDMVLWLIGAIQSFDPDRKICFPAYIRRSVARMVSRVFDRDLALLSGIKPSCGAKSGAKTVAKHPVQLDHDAVLAGSLTVSEPSPERLTEAKEHEQRILAAITRKLPRDREVLALLLRGERTADIARWKGVSRQAIDQRVQRIVHASQNVLAQVCP